ncbi:hypothetical protein IM697_21475 [Streptomyces ferrugineus]|uniref:Uncharacterized protein n=1 Tax=Streptomyces ferrugineus TaxID=1413221 RepID=A0A7M2SXU2_9ACTN|nr:hypothetical protein [Streptomyces ferrugineus]QOV40739.1 hypothetical protein IM697_21475 [Streptomyces ferrugineus]
MTSGRRALTVLHLFLVWATMTAAVPVLGFGLLVSGWGGGAGAALSAFALGVPLVVGLLAMAGIPARTVVPLCGSVSRRLGWAALVFVLGTLGVLAGLAVYGGDVDLGSGGTRIALTGAPYAVAAAFFVPSRWVRLGAGAVLAAGVVYGGFVGPAQAEQRRHAAEVARYRERSELLYLAAAPPGMRVSRAVVGPAYFSVDYGPIRAGYELGHVGLTARPPLTPALRCPEFLEDGVTCTVDVHGEMRMIRSLPGGARDVTLVRRHRDAEVAVSSQYLDEPGLRRLLNTLHPLSDTELEKLMREKAIDQGY